MKELLRQIDDLITDIKNDTNKSKFPELWEKLIELSKIYAEAKQQYTRLKVDRDLLEPRLKEIIRTEFETEQARIESEMTEDELKKYKRPKITVDEVDMKMKLKPQYESNIRNKWEQEEIIAYLDPLLKSYYEWVQITKFTTNIDSKFSNYKD